MILGFIKKYIPYVHKANKAAGWNFQWDRSESCQFTSINTINTYDWHTDGLARKPYEKEGPDKGKIRKLSVTCQLTDGSNIKEEN